VKERQFRLEADSYSIHDMMTMPYASNALLVGIIELDLFSKLYNNPSTLPEVCRMTDLQERPARILLKAFHAFEYLSKRGDRYHLTPLSETFFVKDKPFYLGDAITIYRDNQVTYDQMKRAIRENRPILYDKADDIFNVHRRDDGRALAFTRWMHVRSLVTGSSVAEKFDFSRYHQLVDVGGGSGGISIMIALRHPHMRAAVFDMPPVCETAERMIGEFELAGRIWTIEGDMFSDPFREKFPPDTDVVVFSRILHDWPLEKCGYLLGQAFDVLPPGGTVMIIESLIDESDTKRISPFLENLAMLYCTQGEQFDPVQIEDLLHGAGFCDITSQPIASNYNMVTAHKP